MPDIVCDTSTFQYLYQLDLLHILPVLAERVIVPPSVLQELAAGQASGMHVPDLSLYDWVTVRRPESEAALPLVTDLGPGEAGVLLLALESRETVAVLDDALARRVAETLGLRHTGTLGLLLDAKSAGLVPAVAPLLDRLQSLRFRLAPETRAAVLKLAGEGP